jgi:hypothetical protein
MTTTPLVQWPAKAYAPEGEDLAPPIKGLLTELRLLENPNPEEKVTWDGGTPQSLQVMTSGASAISKLVVSLVAGGGGLAAIATGLNGFFTSVGPDNLDTPLVRTAFILGGSVLGAAVVLALAVVVRSDVTARAHATAAQFQARGTVASALLNSFVVPVAPTTPPPGYAILTEDGSWVLVEEFSWKENKLVAKVDGDLKPAHEWKGIVRCSADRAPQPLA